MDLGLPTGFGSRDLPLQHNLVPASPWQLPTAGKSSKSSFIKVKPLSWAVFCVCRAG